MRDGPSEGDPDPFGDRWQAEPADTLRSLGLKRIGDVVVKEDRPEIRGMVKTVTHLVAVEEVRRHG